MNVLEKNDCRPMRILESLSSKERARVRSAFWRRVKSNLKEDPILPFPLEGKESLSLRHAF